MVVGGGNGSSFKEDSCSFFLEFCFLGIPGKYSQENGTPENLRGDAGLRSGSSGKKNDSKEEEEGESDEQEEEEE